MALFGRLAELEALPIREAYERLEVSAPQLSGLASALAPFPDDEAAQLRWTALLRKRLDQLAGPRAIKGDALLRTNRVLRLLMAYLQITAGGSTLGDPEMPLREIERRMIEELGEREGWTVERRSGGRVVMTATRTFRSPFAPPNAQPPPK